MSDTGIKLKITGSGTVTPAEVPVSTQPIEQPKDE